MDFARLVALLDQQALHFARADQFDDRFEAASGAMDLKPLWDAHYLDFFRHAIKTAPGVTEPPPDEEVEREAARLLEEFSQSAALDRERLFVSCWHANAGESEALWHRYCPPSYLQEHSGFSRASSRHIGRQGAANASRL
jgi:hypothetical protein